MRRPIPDSSPLDMTAEVLLWFRADEGLDRRVPLLDGANMEYWRDDSQYQSSGAEFTNPPTFQTDELNGLPVVRFDGSNDVLTGNRIIASGGYTIAAVVKNDNAVFADFEGILGGVTASGTEEGIIGTSGFASYRADNPPNLVNWINGVNTIATDIQQWHLVIRDDSIFEMTVGFAIGRDRANAARVWTGDIAECMLIDGKVSTADRVILETYFNDKYNLW